MAITHTYTYVIMEISQQAYDEIKQKFEEAGYSHVFHEDLEHGIVMDMNNIALAASKQETKEGVENG